MSWIQTYRGRQFWPLDPRAADLDVRDIAHSLSLQCRFNGHCREFYSVAEHSVRVSDILSAELALWGLLHDLGEAYVGDMPRPVKTFFPDFVTFEERVMRAAAEVYGLSWPMPPEVVHADDLLLATELRDLMGGKPEAAVGLPPPLAEVVVPLDAEAAERAFLERYEELSG